ncbi:YhdP family protein [Arenimonas sp.]|uniref:YhdP family protein n=1 Tax=Arenimonas sp. TaxID=1872635 RepID=UPI0039E5DAF3
MKAVLRRQLRHWRRWFGYGSLVLLILLATLVGVVNQLLPLVEQHPQQIARWLSERVGEPVSFSSAKAVWTRRGPLFTLSDLRVGEGDDVLDIGRAQLQVAVYSGLLPNRPLTELKIRELALTVQQEADGRWHAIGLPGEEQADPLERLEGFGELQIEKAQLTVRSLRSGVDVRMPRSDVRVRVYEDRVRVGASVWADLGSPPVTAVLDMDRERRSGRLWVGGRDIALAHWSSAFASLGLVPLGGKAEADVWLRLEQQRIDDIIVDADIDEASWRSADRIPIGGGKSDYARAQFEHLRALARWRSEQGQWQLGVREFEVRQEGREARLDGLQVRGGRSFAARADSLDLQPLASLLSLTKELPVGLRSFLARSQPSAVLRDVQMSRGIGGRLRGGLRVEALSLQAAGTRPGFSGLSGRIRFDEDGGVMRVESTPVRFEWPTEFRDVLDVRLSGTLGLWRRDKDWVLGATGLGVDGEGYDARARFEIGLQADGSKPTLDLAADLSPSDFDVAKKFWLRGMMPKPAVEWLDRALVEGDVIGGRVAIGGDLDDWPFRNRGGAFDARAQVRNATLKFQNDWPEGRKLDLDVVFDGPGFSVASGKGELLGTHVRELTGGIENFGHTPLDLHIVADGKAEDLRKLLIASPLNRRYGEHLKAASVDGEADVALDLSLPLQAGKHDARIAGSLDLTDAVLADSRWNLRFTGVSGRTHFDQDGFATDNLSVRLDEQPAVFNLRVGRHADDPTLAARADLTGRFSAQTLLQRYEGMAWLRPRLSGQAEWNVSVSVPVAGADGKTPPSRLLVRSDLQGVAMALPAPLDKSPERTWPLELQASLPLEEGTLQLRLGETMRLRGLIRENKPFTGSVHFGGGEPAAMPARGLSVRGNVPVLDSTGWIAFSTQGEGGSLLNDIDVRAAQLQLIDRGFADTHLQLRRAGNASEIRLEGVGIEGTVNLPSQLTDGVQGRFSKLHLAAQSVSAQAEAARVANAGVEPGVPSAPAAASIVEVSDPSTLPPLRFNIEDLRFGQAQLGQTELVTRPIPAGMRIEKFETRAKTLSLSVAGEWVRENEATRSNMRLDFSANNLGQMLDALGFAGMVQGGKTRATLTGSWPGSPGAFSLATMNGTLRADIGEGRLLDVEPGGSGRMLGLMSIAEIPRRLSLDFSDFFSKGFAFNSARGDFVFSGGKARTDNLRVDGPAAEIRVSGTTGMRDQTYDQRVEVLPKAGSVLPAIGMLAGGPAGAAVGLVAQAVLQKPLKQTTRVVYRVTGPWQKPDVEVIERGPAKSATAQAQP